MFKGLLEIAPRCDACGADFKGADVGDGASVFALFIIGFLSITLFLLIAVAFRGLPWWGHMIIQVPFIFGASIPHPEAPQSTVVCMQFQHDAQQANCTIACRAPCCP